MSVEREAHKQQEESHGFWRMVTEKYPELEKYGSGEQVVVDGALMMMRIDMKTRLIKPAFYKKSGLVRHIPYNQLTEEQKQVYEQVNMVAMEEESRLGYKSKR